MNITYSRGRNKIIGIVKGTKLTKIQKRIVFGYNRNANDKIELHPIQSMVVKYIYMCCADGSSLRQIKKTLESCNIISPQNKSVWSQQSIANILAYDRYVGDDTYPPIIDTELLERVRMVQRSHTANNKTEKLNENGRYHTDGSRLPKTDAQASGDILPR